MTALRVLVFVLVEIVLLPFMIPGFILFFWIMSRCKKAGVSYTAYEPLGARILFDAAGSRRDWVAWPLLRALPTTPAPVAWLAYGPLIAGIKISGWVPAAFSYPGPRPSTVISMFAHRTEFLDRVVEEAAPGTQFVVLGAGWDTRAWRVDPERISHTFEVDAPPTSAAKRIGVADARIPADRVTFVAVDFNQERWLDRLVDEGFDLARPAVVLWEGVTYYLEPDAALATLTDAARLAPGSVVAFDYFGPELSMGLGPKRLRQAQKMLDRIGEPWVFGIDADSEGTGARDFVEGAGLALRYHEPYGPPEDVFGGIAEAVVPQRLESGS